MVKHTQIIRRPLPPNCLSVFDHFVGLVLKGLSIVTLIILVKIFWNNVTCIIIVTYIFYYRVDARTELWNCSYINKVNRVIFAFALWLFQWILKLAYGRHYQIFGNVITKSLEQQRKVFVITKFVLQDDY